MKSLIVTPTPKLEASLEFYQKLGFRLLPHEDLTLVTDGKAFIQIDSTRTARAGVKLYRERWEEAAETLGQSTRVHSTDQGYFLSDPNGVQIYLVEGDPPTLEAEAQCFSTLGKFAGLSVECTDFDRSAALWTKLGFSHTMGDPIQGWSAYARPDGFGLSLMTAGSCPHLVFNPSMTYFNSGKNLEAIAKIKEAQIPITEEITRFNEEGIADNVIVRDPGGYGFYVFND